MPIIRMVLVALIAATVYTSGAAAMAYKDIAGRWCGSTTNYTFSKDRLVVTFHNGSPTKRFKITRYNYTDQSVTIDWINDKKEVFTTFAEFGADGTMFQQKNEAGPRRPFRRC